MRSTRASSSLLALLLPALAAACASEPYEVVPPGVSLSAYGVGAEDSAPDRGAGRARPRTIAVCYNGAFNEPAEVLAEVRQICPGKGEIIRVDDNVFWNNCSLSKPTRATFICIPGPARASKLK